jgi:endonuclease/exonuclease/phosphatase family metal-dependent hydrolase
MFIINRIVFILNSLVIIALLLSYLAPYISPELVWHIAFMGLAYPMLVLLNVVFIIYWGLFFNMKFLFSLCAIVIGWKYVPRYVQISEQKKPSVEAAANQWTVVSFNARYFGVLDDFKSNEQSLFIDKLERLAPDVFCAQEFHVPSMPWNELQKQFLAYFKNYKWVNGIHASEMNRTENVIIFSKHKIIQSGLVERENMSGNFTIYADIAKGIDTLRFINTHLQSIGFSKDEYRVIMALMGDKDSVSFSQLRGVGAKMKYAYLLRAKQVEAIRSFIEQSPHKVVMCGDFNDSPVSYAYRQIRGSMKDAFMEAGSGLGRTYIGTAPSLRIDYIMYHQPLRAYDYYAKGFDFSDHKMVSTKLVLPVGK